MDFYELTLFSPPKTEFVYYVEKSNYQNSFPSSPKLLETALCLEGNVVYEFPNGTKRVITPKTVTTYVDGVHCRTYAEKSGIQRHITFGVAADFKTERYNSDTVTAEQLKIFEARTAAGSSILLPDFADIGDNARDVEAIISKALPLFYSHEPADSLRCLSVWYELCAYLTAHTLSILRSQFFSSLPSDEMYVEAAVHFISEHLSRRLRVADIAESISISSGYLQNLFKKITGVTVIEYINRERIELIKGYTSGDRMTLAEASRLAGIEDEAYASRLFKKVSGMSFAQYRTQCKTKKQNTVIK